MMVSGDIDETMYKHTRVLVFALLKQLFDVLRAKLKLCIEEVGDCPLLRARGTGALREVEQGNVLDVKRPHCGQWNLSQLVALLTVQADLQQSHVFGHCLAGT